LTSDFYNNQNCEQIAALWTPKVTSAYQNSVAQPEPELKTPVTADV